MDWTEQSPVFVRLIKNNLILRASYNEAPRINCVTILNVGDGALSCVCVCVCVCVCAYRVCI